MLKSTTVDRYKAWCKTAKKSDKFHWQGKSYTQAEFDALHFGGAEKTTKQINKDTDIQEKEHGDMGQTHDSGHTQES